MVTVGAGGSAGAAGDGNDRSDDRSPVWLVDSGRVDDTTGPALPHSLFLVLAGLIVLALVGVAVVNQRRATQLHPAPPQAVPTVRNDPTLSALALPGRPIDIAASGSQLYVLAADPGRLMLLDHSHPNKLLQATPVDTGGHAQLVVDPDSARVWVLRTDVDGASTLTEFDALSLTPLHTAALGHGVSDVVSLDDDLWLATEAGLGRLTLYPVADQPRGPTLTAVRGLVTALAVSRFDASVLVATADGTRTVLRRVSGDTGAVIATAALPIHGVTLAVVGTTVWAAGERNDGKGTVLRLSASTLRPEASAVTAAAREAGVTVWAGTQNLWVLDGGVLSCLQPTGGALLASAPRLSGPVVSNSGYAYAIGSRMVKVLDLSPTACAAG